MTGPTIAISEDDPVFVTALARGLAVIRAFDATRERQTLADIARTTGLARATVRRSLLTLEALGYVRTHGKQFALTPRILSLGFSYLAATPLARIIQPVLELVSERTQESCAAAVLDGGQIVFLARAASKRILSAGSTVGSQLPAYCTAMGRVLLAHEPLANVETMLEQTPLRALTPRTLTDPLKLRTSLMFVREDGYALVDEELEIGLRSVAVPIKTMSGTVVAAMNVSVQSSRVSVQSLLDTALPVLKDAAAQIRPALMG